MAISDPSVQEIPGGYKIYWTQGQEGLLTVWVRRVQESHGNTYGEFSIEHLSEPDMHPLVGIKVNLSSKRGRDDIVKRLKELKYTAIIDWDAVIEQVCGEVLARQRIGDPGSLIEANDDEIVPPEYYLEPFIMKSVPNVVFGEKGSHKTTIAQVLTACVSLPWTDNPLELSTNYHPIRVGYLDWEGEESLVKYNILRLRRGLNIPYFTFDYRRCRLSLVDDIEQISNFISRNGDDLIIIDSLGGACGGDLYKPEPALKYFEGLRSLKRTSFIIAQTSKNEEGKKTIFGSTYFQYYSRNIFEVKSSITSPDETSIAFFHRWANYSKQYEPIGFHLTFSPQSITVEREAVKYSEFLEKVNRQQQALELLSDGPKFIEEIMKELSISRNNADKLMGRLKTKKQVIKLPDGRWGLLSNTLI